MKVLRPLFSGGLYLPSEKKATLDAPINPAPSPPWLFVPLRQHAGPAAEPVVGPGRDVLLGQMIGRPADRASAAVHSPVSGRVWAIEQVRLFDGDYCPAVVIESDGRDRWAPLGGPLDPADLTPDNFAERFADWGLVQMQPGGQPLHRRIEAARAAGVHTIVVNAMESEPYITAEHRLTVEQTLLVALGLAHLCRLAGADRGIVAVDHRRQAEAQLLDNLLQDHAEEHGLALGAACLDNVYPQGHPLMLLKTLFDEEVEVGPDDPSGESACDRAGVCVLAVGSVAAAADAMLFDRPLTHRVVTVSGDAVGAPGNFTVPVGMKLGDLLARCQPASAIDRLIVGGPMTGVAQPDDQSVFTKQTSGAVLFRDALVHQPGPCIRCGWCVDGCPVRINPSLLCELAESARPDPRCRHAAACIECNICSYVCPSRLPLGEQIRKLKRTRLAAGLARPVPSDKGPRP